MDSFDWKSWIIIVLLIAIFVINSILVTHTCRVSFENYDGLTSDQLSWVIEGRKEALVDDWERLIEAIIRQKQLLSE